MANNYAEVDALKNRIEEDSSAYDVVFQEMLDGAARQIDRFCNRPDGFVAVDTADSRIYAGSGEAVQKIDECVEITLVATKASPSSAAYTSWAATDWIAFDGPADQPDFQPTVHFRPYTRLMTHPTGDYALFTSGFYPEAGWGRARQPHGVPTVQVTAKWGYAVAVPPDIHEVCVAQAAAWWKRAQAGYADTLAAIEMGRLFVQKGLDPIFKAMLTEGRYIRRAI